MSFMCKPCHDKAEKREEEKKGKEKGHSFKSHTYGSFGISYGPCEDCGKVRETVDCHEY